ncbi:MAG: XRE family transcriptional regulator [Bdellovibrionaceae bacterium]|nr:XRE family transcriptional regulator [Pseudobdellovibrionaceae bacterium]
MKVKARAENRNELRRKLVADVESGGITIGEALVMARAILNKNQADYAKSCGNQQKIIANIEMNRGNPTIETINKLFAPVGLSIGLKTVRARARIINKPE